VLRDFHCGGSPLPLDLVQGFHDRFGIWLRDNWGMTEMHGTTTGHFNDGSRPVIGSAGRPLPFVKVKAVHLDEDGQWVGDCAPGERGTLLLSSPTVTRGYVNPDLDDEFFPPGVVVDPATGHRWGNTGDLGTVDPEGYVWVYGRAKDLIIRGGHNIDPKEVEDVLSKHPEVHVAAAVGRPDRAKGELPVAYVQLVAGASTSEDELLDFCRGRVAERAAVPVQVTILDEIPLTPVGKISKPRLREMAILDEARRVVGRVLGDDACHADVSLDRAAARPCVVVSLERVPEAATRADDLRAALGGYEFASVVLVVSPVG
jgi:fatty-acyl-CoA synthase